MFSSLRSACAQSARRHLCRAPLRVSTHARPAWVSSMTSPTRFMSSDKSATESDDAAADAAGDAQEADTAAAQTDAAAGNKATEKADPNSPEELKKQVADWKAKYLSALAEQQNVITRMQKQNQQTAKFGIQKFAVAMIETADVLQMAADSIDASALKSNPEISEEALRLITEMHDGVAMTKKNMLGKFKSFDITCYKSLGEKFDPTLHDGVFEMEDPSREVGTVGVVTNQGYKLGDRVIRAAKVGTVRASK